MIILISPDTEPYPADLRLFKSRECPFASVFVLDRVRTAQCVLRFGIRLDTNVHHTFDKGRLHVPEALILRTFRLCVDFFGGFFHEFRHFIDITQRKCVDFLLHVLRQNHDIGAVLPVFTGQQFAFHEEIQFVLHVRHRNAEREGQVFRRAGIVVRFEQDVLREDVFDVAAAVRSGRGVPVLTKFDEFRGETAFSVSSCHVHTLLQVVPAFGNFTFYGSKGKSERLGDVRQRPVGEVVFADDGAVVAGQKREFAVEERGFLGMQEIVLHGGAIGHGFADFVDVESVPRVFPAIRPLRVVIPRDFPDPRAFVVGRKAAADGGEDIEEDVLSKVLGFRPVGGFPQGEVKDRLHIGFEDAFGCCSLRFVHGFSPPFIHVVSETEEWFRNFCAIF